MAERRAARDALATLREVVGESFLRRARTRRATEPPHPLVQIVINRVAWTRLLLIRYAEALRVLRGAENFSGLRKRIRSAKNFAEGVSVLEVALEFHQAGFDVAFDPNVIVTAPDGSRGPKRPDLRVTTRDLGEVAIVEVSLLTRSAAWRRAEMDSSFVLSLLFEELGPARLTMYAQMNECFDKSRVEATLVGLRRMIEEVKRTGEFREYVTDCIEAGIAPQSDEEPLKRWAEARGLQPCIAGPPVESDELSRVVMKIRDKLAQLPDESPGIIVIPATGSSILHRYPTEDVIAVIADEVSRYPKVLCVVLTHGFIDGRMDESFAVATEDSAVVNRNIGALREQAILVRNPMCIAPVSHNLLQRVRRAFIHL